MTDTVTVGIISHDNRHRYGLLQRAINSVLAQTQVPDMIIVRNDSDRQGAGTNRQRLLQHVTTKWLAWLDSDDEWDPDHLEKLMLVGTSAPDIAWVYSWMKGTDPLGHFGIPFDPCRPHHTTMGILERTDIAQEIGFPPSATEGKFSNEDWAHITQFAAYCCERGLRMVHLAERTWTYHSGGQNTSGQPTQGDAA